MKIQWTTSLFVTALPFSNMSFSYADSFLSFFYITEIQNVMENMWELRFFNSMKMHTVATPSASYWKCVSKMLVCFSHLRLQSSVCVLHLRSGLDVQSFCVFVSVTDLLFSLLKHHFIDLKKAFTCVSGSDHSGIFQPICFLVYDKKQEQNFHNNKWHIDFRLIYIL